MEKSKYFYCVVKCLTVTPENKDINIRQPMFYPLSTILNYYCWLSPLYIHIVLIFNCI